MTFYFLIAFLPLTIWVWDIPFTSRFICRHFHDNKLLLLGYSIKSRYFYVIGIVIYFSFLSHLIYKLTHRNNV